MPRSLFGSLLRKENPSFTFETNTTAGKRQVKFISRGGKIFHRTQKKRRGNNPLRQFLFRIRDRTVVPDLKAPDAVVLRPAHAAFEGSVLLGQDQLIDALVAPGQISGRFRLVEHTTQLVADYFFIVSHIRIALSPALC